ncbi:UvrD-helicase domain-containing protein, partial [Planctomycetota bacterium]
MPEVDQLFAAGRSSMIAAAGAGKTTLIVAAVERRANQRHLILTHTHAGVHVLRCRLRSRGVSASAAKVDTIASWALRYANAYPATTGRAPGQPTDQAEWDQLYLVTPALLRTPFMKRVLANSYDGVFVDEYQDCTLGQHEIVCAIAETLPTRVLGDHLQGVFEFRNTQTVSRDWNRYVVRNFPAIRPLDQPRRWQNTNPALGGWLQQVRVELLAGRPIDLRDPSVNWIQLPAAGRDVQATQQRACFGLRLGNGETAAAIHQHRNQTYYISARLNGRFTAIEPIDSQDLAAAATAIDRSSGPLRAAEVLKLARKCMTQVGTELSTVLTAFEGNRIPRRRTDRHRSQFDALKSVAETAAFPPVIRALESLKKLDASILYRPELFYETIRALRAVIQGSFPNLAEALSHARNQTRYIGRRIPRCVLSTPLLLKGLEFDHAIVLDADRLQSSNGCSRELPGLPMKTTSCLS